ncbi:hypothetical protein CC80DRAFT_538153 [Byssothecium circinans]|uniref:Phosphoglycerate mutase-like protein n=1 Tax=Byssothecium circinans TaxID=147558 RepID=A0A6A5TKL3_9PLEO|nr:hypothetical protein CC80DRAFT_538153 [Byssothecium circinans]
MAKGPAVVVIARHGARLDAADKQWHLTSPTPYDPPLTYGGWSQGRALGIRIAALLHQRENDRSNEATNADLAHLDFSTLDAGTGKGKAVNGVGHKRKKHRIVIHSSPYLRCIQTSTAIAAGLSQFQPPDAAGDAVTRLNVPTPAKQRNGLAKSTSPAVQPVRVMEPAADPNLEVFPRPHAGPEKILLRIDAFLGEWLSPDYFADITPPPNSTMMVAGAKADLLRRGEYVEAQPAAPSSKGHFPGGWVKTPTSSVASSRKNTEDGPLPTLGSLAQALPTVRERSNSQGSGYLRRRSRSRESLTPAISTPHKLPSHIYEAPVPSYAVSPADPIPRGYFAHARDACVNVDFQWDSMREPQDWGDGGEYGDEWSTMHKRFRRGLAGMMRWYREHGAMAPKDQFPGFTFNERPKGALQHASTEPLLNSDAEAEDDEELVLILVTHGAGCNALLGAVTNQPVLIDVGLAALSMAVQRDEPRRPSVSPKHQRHASIIDPGMSDTYEMKLLASTDHLRPNVDPSKPPQPQSPPSIASPSLEYRRRFAQNPSGMTSPVSQIDSPFSLGEPASIRGGWNSALGSIRRSSTNGSGSTRLLSSYTAGSASPRTSSGLWSSTRAPSFSLDDNETEGSKSPSEDMLLNFGNQLPTKPSAAPTSTPAQYDTSPSTSTKTSSSGNSSSLNVGRPSTPTQAAINLSGNGGGAADDHEDTEKHDDVAPLRNMNGAAPRRTPSVGGGLWMPKNQAGANGLWGPPRLDEVYEHGRGPKRRWTVTEREQGKMVWEWGYHGLGRGRFVEMKMLQSVDWCCYGYEHGAWV